MKRLLHPVPVLILVLLAGISALQAQNSLAVNPGTIFLNAAANGAAVQQTFTLTSSPTAAVPFTAVFNNASWLSLTPVTGSTPATITATAIPGGLAPGIYSATVTFSSSSGTSATLLVVLTVNNLATPLTPNPSSVVFTYQPGAPLPAAVTLNITTGNAAPPFTIVPLSAPWLLIGQAASSITVALSPGGLTAGQTYVGGIQIAPSGGQPPLIVPVVLYYGLSAQVTVAPASLNFNYQIGGTNNSVQKMVTVTPGSTTFTAAASVAPGTAQWLTVNPTSGTGAVTVNVLPAGLPVGTYQGSVAISAAGSNPITVPVTLNVSAQAVLDLSTNALTYTYQAGNPNPPDQTVTLNSTTPGLAFTVVASSSGNWLSINVTNALTGTPVTVSVNPGGLPGGTYNGTVTFNAIGASNNPQIVNVTLTVTNNPTLNASPNPLLFNYQIGQAIPVAQSVSVTSPGGPLTFTVSGSGTSGNINWLLTGPPTSTTTPASFTVGVNPIGLAANVYNGSVQIATPGATALTVPVTLNVSNVALLNLPGAINFTSVAAAQPGQVGPSQNVIVTSTGEAVTYAVTASISTPAGGNWLVVGAASGPASNVLPSSFIVATNPSGLPAGVYKGSLLVHASNGTPDITIPVTYTITAGNMTVTPATLNFTQTAGGLAPAAQNVAVSSSGTALTFSALTTVSTTANWLSVTPSTGVTPGNVAVSVNAGNLQPGTYNGTVSFTSTQAGNSPQTVAVTLTVGQPQNLTVTPATLTFTSQVGSPAPATQTIGVTASAGTLPFTVAATGTSGGNTWLSVTPSNSTAAQTAANLTVSVNPQGLAAGTYAGTVVVTGQGASNGPQTINVTYVLVAIPPPVPTTIQNAGDLTIGAVSPGEIITIKGTNLGPAAPATTTISAAGFFATTLSDTQVLFDNIPAAMWYTSATQINAIVPYEIAGRASTLMQVVYKGTPSSTINLLVAPAAPGIFVNASGQIGAYNQNGTVNGPANPAPKGTTVVMWATGEGATNPPGVTGRVIPLDPTQLKHPLLPASMTIGGVPAEIQYIGSAPGFVSGALQVNVVVPDTAPSGSAVPVVLTIGTINSLGRATLAIQ